MKQWVRPLTEDGLLEDFPIRSRLDGWFFRINEVSGGVYRADGTDVWGRTVARDGTDPDKLLAECEADARAVLSSGEKAP